MKTRFLLLVAVVLLLVPFGVGAQDQTVVDVIAGNADLSTLAGLIETAGLAETLSGEGPFTVFAPTNAAFEALPAPVVAYLTSEAGKETLTAVLTYHVVPASVLAVDVTTGDVASVAGDAISLEVTDAGVKVENAVVVTPDLAASNGVVHVIDAVILPDVELPAVDPLTVEGDVVTAGSSTVYPVSEAMAARFTEEGYAGNVTVDSIGSGAGFERFCVNGETDIANASRKIKQEEIDACAALTPASTPMAFRIGTDALAIVVSAENDFVQDVTKEELA
ncbi:MAG TPA: fasciclin domain-containing protein, partial [Phototrophicaceae bacterium]|nr:fasciclin domain-containing protein [Phototrophicaceae bacterium]